MTPAATSEEPARRCAIYTRKSAAIGLEQEVTSLDVQREACASYVTRQPGWVLLPERYDDGGFSGASTDRPAFNRLMADIDAGKFDVLVCYKVDRLSRSLIDFVKVMERMSARGVSFVSVTQNFSTADALGRLTLNMLMSFAEFERSMIIDRTRDKLQALRRKGKWTGGPVPYGYTLEGKRLLVNEGEARVVREMFTLYLDCGTVAEVARTLNARGHERRSLGRSRRSGTLWCEQSVARALRCAHYAGLVKLGKDWIAAEHAPLIEQSAFRRVQERLAAHRSANVPARPVLESEAEAEVLRGLLRCAACDAPMVLKRSRVGTKLYRYYRCNAGRKYRRGQCPTKPLPADALEAFVAEQIGNAVTQGELPLATAQGAASQWLDRTLRDFTDAWALMTPQNRRRLLLAVVHSVRVDGATGEVAIELAEPTAPAEREAVA